MNKYSNNSNEKKFQSKQSLRQLKDFISVSSKKKQNKLKKKAVFSKKMTPNKEKHCTLNKSYYKHHSNNTYTTITIL